MKQILETLNNDNIFNEYKSFYHTQFALYKACIEYKKTK